MQAAFQTRPPANTPADAPASAPAVTDLPEPRDFIPRLIRSHNKVVNEFEKICGLHMARWRLLFNLARQGTASQNELSRSTTIAPAAVTRILADMERSGLISRQPSQQDKRQILVSLTRSGTELLRHTAARREIFLGRALAGFTESEVAQLENLLGRLEINLGTQG